MDLAVAGITRLKKRERTIPDLFIRDMWGGRRHIVLLFRRTIPQVPWISIISGKTNANPPGRVRRVTQGDWGGILRIDLGGWYSVTTRDKEVNLNCHLIYGFMSWPFIKPIRRGGREKTVICPCFLPKGDL